MQLAIKTRIKLFYRPNHLQAGVEQALEQIEVKAENKQFRITNNSPYYVTLANVDDKKVKNIDRFTHGSAVFTCFSTN